MNRLSRALLLVAVALASLPAAPAAPAPTISVPVPPNPFGAQFGPDPVRFDVLEALGAAYIRTGVTVSQWQDRCFDCAQAESRGIGVVLRVKANGTSETATTMPTDLNAYRGVVSDIAATLQPSVIVVENEPDSRQYWAGTVEEYEQLLTVACDAAHEHGIPCTGGGLSNTAVVSMVYRSYKDRGDHKGARRYASKISLSSTAYTKMIAPENKDKIKQIAEKAEAYLATHVAAGADLVNFHWYRSEEAFGETVRYLVDKTGLPPMNNEIGQYTDAGGDTTALMNAVLAADLRFATWMSIDLLHKRDNKEIVALHNPDGTLRPSGKAFRAKTDSL